jgi:hypothetical protein
MQLTRSKEQLFSRLTEEQIDRCIHEYDSTPQKTWLDLGIETNTDLLPHYKGSKSLLPEPWYFPYAGQWNDENPFRKIKEINIKNLNELADIAVVVEE